MEYSIRQLARLSGVTTRTLRWYDEIGLLTPSRIADNGYRFYGPGEVDRLQLILFYRALGVELSRIKEILDAPSFDRLAALRSHLAALRREQERLGSLIAAVQQTIDSEERNAPMQDKDKFEALKRSAIADNEKTYGKALRETYGDQAIDAANAAMMNMTPEQHDEWKALGEAIQQALETAVQGSASPEGEAGQQITKQHARWLTLTGMKYDFARHRGIAALYVIDPRFTAYYDKTIPGCAQFLTAAVQCWAK